MTDPFLSAGVELDIEPGDAEEMKSVLREWLLGGAAAQQPELFAEVMPGGTLLSKVMPPEEPWGPPEAPWSSLSASWWNGVGVSPAAMDGVEKPSSTVSRDGPFSQRRLDWILADKRPLVMWVQTSMRRLDATGTVPMRLSAGAWDVVGSVDSDDPVVASLLARLRPGIDDVEAIIAFARQMADRVDVVFGQIGPRVDVGQTTFESSLPHSPHGTDAMRQGREFLRGYNWVTVVPPELVARLGGAKQLRESGAFYSVEQLASGALWLQATPTLEEFDMNAVWRVFKAVAPVLRTGLPVDRTLAVPIPTSTNGSSIPGRPDHWAVAIADAAEYI